MKPTSYLTITLLAVVIHLPLFGQVQVRSLPENDFESRIHDYVTNIKMVDTHEHLIGFEQVKTNMPLDFMLIFHHYADDDIKSAGMSKPQFEELMGNRYSVNEKWKIFEPYWEVSKNTAYNRVPLIIAEQLFGVQDINTTTIGPLSKAIKESYNNPDWYNYVLKEKSGIEYAILDVGSRRFEDPKFSYLERFDQFIRVSSASELLKNIEQKGTSTPDLNDYIAALRNAFELAVARGIVGVKSGLAYHRTLHYEDVDASTARHLFRVVMQGPSDKEYPFEVIKPLQDYIMHQIVQLAGEYKLPMVIHTGLQAGDGNIITNSNPALLANLFLQYREVRFSLYHGGYPYGGELASLAKNFRNVFIDMCWLYIISPSYSERFLHEWLETVPANKIMAFGGDYHNVENVYGHAFIARQVIAKVLTEKTRTGYFTESEAIKIADMILRHNALNFYGIDE